MADKGDIGSTLRELVVPDLLAMEASGKFDRDVLLWIQARFSAGVPQPVREEICERYREAKAAGAVVGVKAYRHAARECYGHGAALCVRQLDQLVLTLKETIGAGTAPDLESTARVVLAVKARMANLSTLLRSIAEHAGAAAVAADLKSKLQMISRAAVAVNGGTIYAGRDLLRVVADMERNPQWFDGRAAGDVRARRGVDFAPGRRR